MYQPIIIIQQILAPASMENDTHINTVRLWYWYVKNLCKFVYFFICFYFGRLLYVKIQCQFIYYEHDKCLSRDSNEIFRRLTSLLLFSSRDIRKTPSQSSEIALSPMLFSKCDCKYQNWDIHQFK